MLVPFEQISGEGKIWIFDAGKIFTPTEKRELTERLYEFLANWKSHQVPVPASFQILYDAVLVLAADESANAIGGCSQDDLFRTIQQIQKGLSLNFFQRTLLPFKLNGELRWISLENATSDAALHEDSLVLNKWITRKQEWDNQHFIPIKNSWLKSRFVREKTSAV